MSTGSSGCVFNKFTQLLSCEKRCNSVEARKALLQKFTSDVYAAEVYYVDNDGKTTEENYRIAFKLSENQSDPTMNKIHGNAILATEEDTPIKLAWLGTYLANKNEYKMKLTSTEENIEKDFYLYCGGNDKINFLIKKTVSETSETVGPRNQPFRIKTSSGAGTLRKDLSVVKCVKNCASSDYNNCVADCEDNCDASSYYSNCYNNCEEYYYKEYGYGDFNCPSKCKAKTKSCPDNCKPNCKTKISACETKCQDNFLNLKNIIKK